MTRTAPSPDPRTIITPDSFSVAPELLGLPLAGPWRRLWAMLLDLVPLAILAGAGPVTFLAFFLAILVWRAIAAVRPTGFLARAGVGMGRLGFAILAFVLVLQIGDRLFGDEREADTADVVVPTRAAFSSPDSLEAFIERTAGREAAAEFAEAVGVARPEQDSSLSSAARDSIVVRYATLLANRDTTSAQGMQNDAMQAIAGARIGSLEADRDALRQANRDLRSRIDDLEERLEEAERPLSLRAMIFGFADDLGIGFGWGALYFSMFLTLGGGQTPGKRLAGVRVVRLDGKPMSWWYSFERFGGYFACLTTGLLGFAQILWDRNRQGLHDKIVETVVVRERRRTAKA